MAAGGRAQLRILALIVGTTLVVGPVGLPPPAGAETAPTRASSTRPAPGKVSPGRSLPATPKAPRSPERTDQWLVVPGERVGVITPRTSEEDLVRIFGPDRVARRPLALGDAETRTGTIVLASTLDALEVLWRDDQFHGPERVIIGGGKTRWRTREGVTIGTTLDELARLNGRPFRLSGFGWEGGGIITSWEGGRLAATFPLGHAVVMRLGADRPFEDLRPEDRTQILGRQEILSAHPALARLGLKVWEIIVLFP